MALTDEKLDNITSQLFSSVRMLQAVAGQNSTDHGFRAEGDLLRANLLLHSSGTPAHALHSANLRNYYVNRLMLIIGEVSEAHEEVRHGRQMTETYYADSQGNRYDAHLVEDAQLGGASLKPEGVPSELADTFIRLLDLCDEAAIDLASATQEKMIYNESRPFMHGKKF